MALLCLVWLGGVGAVDDWLKLTAGRRGGSRQGLTSLEKLLFQIGLACVLAYLHLPLRPRTSTPRTHFYLPFFKDSQLPLSLAAFIVLGTLVIAGFSNAVNLTDGLDGLAAGAWRSSASRSSSSR